MNFEQAVAIAYENMSDRMMDVYGEPQKVECSVCKELYWDVDPRWQYGHDCAKDMQEGDAWVCCEECKNQWLEKYWDYVEEYEYLKEKK